MSATPPPGFSEPPRRIHLYRPQNQFGDLLLNVPAIRAIRARYPEAKITLIVGRQNAPAVQGQRWADTIRIVRTRNFLAMATSALVRMEKPDWAVYFTTVSYSRSGAWLVARSGAQERIGFDPATYGVRDRARLTRALPYPTGPMHQSRVSLLLAAAIGAVEPPPPPHYEPDPALVERAPHGVVYIHPGAGKHKNRWSPEGFATVAGELLRQHHDVRLLEGPQDAGTTGAVARRVRHALPVVRGEPLSMLAARFRRAALYLGNDTGPLHLAGAVGCPTVGLYGWSNPEEWSPLGSRVRTVRAPDHTLASVTPDQVLSTALGLLDVARYAVA